MTFDPPIMSEKVKDTLSAFLFLQVKNGKVFVTVRKLLKIISDFTFIYQSIMAHTHTHAHTARAQRVCFWATVLTTAPAFHPEKHSL